MIHLVNLGGTFKDTMGAGPFSGAKPVMREGYRMLGGIIVTKDLGQYFIKVTGPDEIVSQAGTGLQEDAPRIREQIAPCQNASWRSTRVRPVAAR